MKKISLLLLTLLAFACSPKKETGVRANTAGAAGITGVGPVVTSVCAQAAAMGGAIVDAAQIKYEPNDVMGTFEDRTKAFLTTTIAPERVGYINPQIIAGTGVSFKGVIKLEASGNVVGAQSKLTIEVRDSEYTRNLIYNRDEVPITVEFLSTNPGTVISGQFNAQTGIASINLKDNYGEVRFDGRIDAQNFSGTVTFINSVSVSGAPMRGTIGSFSIPRCALLQ
ncbi:MAG: hypothetical protein H7061_14790 [Bdellovibrionaceae bacterium]|nr:hypothetical protein [Bdellovibrio sp.]